jgi:hypothetical protein
LLLSFRFFYHKPAYLSLLPMPGLYHIPAELINGIPKTQSRSTHYNNTI